MCVGNWERIGQGSVYTAAATKGDYSRDDSKFLKIE